MKWSLQKMLLLIGLGRRFSGLPVAADVALLYERIADLEEQLARYRQGGEGAIEKNDPITYLPEADSHGMDQLETSIEHLNLGLGDGEPSSADRLDPERGQLDVAPDPFLLSRHTSTAMVRFALSHFGWLHCALRARDFLEEHERFWDALDIYDFSVLSQSSFIAIYYAVLSGGFYYVDAGHEALADFSFYDPTRSLGFDAQATESLMQMSRYWYQSSLRELEASDFLGRPKLSTVQTVAILTLVNSSFGESKREWILMGATVKMARLLHMHNLGSDHSFHASIEDVPEWSNPAKRALGRRLWWTLVICDWLGVMSHRPSILPRSFNTVMEPDSPYQMEVHCLDEAPDSTPSVVSCLQYHELLANLARIINTYVKGPRGYAEKNRVDAIKEVEKLYAECPSHLREQTPPPWSTDGLPPWLFLQQYLAMHTIQFIRLTISRSFFVGWIRRQPDPEGLHVRALEAAGMIAATKQRTMPLMYQKNWVVCASVVAAGVLLCLDSLFFSTGESPEEIRRRRASAGTCLNTLRSLSPVSVIAKRGVSVLEALLDIDATWDYTIVPDQEALVRIVEHVSHIQKIDLEGPAKPAIPRRASTHTQHEAFGGPASWSQKVAQSRPEEVTLETMPGGFLEGFRNDGTMPTSFEGGFMSSTPGFGDYGASGTIASTLCDPTEGYEPGVDEIEGFDNPFQVDGKVHSPTM